MGQGGGRFFTLGEELYVARCASCHGATGGGGVGPGFAGGSVLVTFPAGSCAAEDGHIAWVTVGTSGWPDPTYGATAKPVGGVGVMPPFGEALTEEELAAVVLYERVAFRRRGRSGLRPNRGTGHRGAVTSYRRSLSVWTEQVHRVTESLSR